MQQHQIKEKNECADSESETDESDLDFIDVESDDYVSRYKSIVYLL